MSTETDEIQAQVEAAETAEQKARIVLEAMRTSIAQEGKPQLGRFWELRKLCLPLLQQEVHPAVRGQLWAEYRDVTAEARRLKSLFDKESDFASEQIELAIDALEQEIGKKEEMVAAATSAPFETSSPTLKKNATTYEQGQRELALLNSWMGRVNALRDELSRTDMRVGKKSKLFRRLSSAGDHIFPRRKELRQQLGDTFLTDVHQFVERNFSGDQITGTFFALRDEIKAFQALAKQLSVTGNIFTQSREALSGCWEKLSAQQGEFKQEQEAKRAQSQELVSQFKADIEAVKTGIEKGELDDGAAAKQLDAIGQQIQEADLAIKERKAARAMVSDVRQVIYSREKEAQKERQKQAQQKRRASEELLEALKQKCDVAADKEALERIRADAVDSELVTEHQAELLAHCKLANERLTLAEEEKIIAGSATHEQLKQVLAARKKRRKTIKERYEKNRRAAGGSGLDFEAALQGQEQLDLDREELAGADEAVAQVELILKEK